MNGRKEEDEALKKLPLIRLEMNVKSSTKSVSGRRKKNEDEMVNDQLSVNAIVSEEQQRSDLQASSSWWRNNKRRQFECWNEIKRQRVRRPVVENRRVKIVSNYRDSSIPFHLSHCSALFFGDIKLPPIDISSSSSGEGRKVQKKKTKSAPRHEIFSFAFETAVPHILNLKLQLGSAFFIHFPPLCFMFRFRTNLTVLFMDKIFKKVKNCLTSRCDSFSSHLPELWSCKPWRLISSEPQRECRIQERCNRLRKFRALDNLPRGRAHCGLRS